MDPLLIVDGRHYLHRFHVDHPRAALGVEEPLGAKPLVTRFEEIWGTGEPGLAATVLGLLATAARRSGGRPRGSAR